VNGIPFPDFDPVAFSIFGFPIRWYSLAYIVGLFGGLYYAKRLAARVDLWGGRTRPTGADLDDLLLYAAIGVILGGRLAFVMFYQPSYYLAKPIEILAIWTGGMSFHGGLAGAAVAIWFFARRKNIPVFSLFDIAAAVAPIGIGLGRIANFINGELWGRTTDVSWGVIFPHAGPIARHPSQLYEAATEGLILLLMLAVIAYRGGLKQPGRIAGLFGIGYAIARIGCEFFREPDPQLGFIAGGFLTMGMLLSLPVLFAGLWIFRSSRKLGKEQV
jgi:phosphatidylglycerol---prolipoprotein diacylglyceryl transferase